MLCSSLHRFRFTICCCAALGAGMVAAQPLPEQMFDCEGVSPAAGTELRVELVTDNLSNPVGLETPSGDTDRIFVLEQEGRIRIVELPGNHLLDQPFLDMTNLTRCCGEEGLLGLAFHPAYAQNGYFYVFYSRRAEGNIEVSRFTVSAGDPNRADPASARSILIIPHRSYRNHYGGQLAFGPRDGYLYIATGDGGGDGAPSQDPLNLLGKILRLNVDAGDPYEVPSTNPFLGMPEVRPEIWAIGLRNPWRFAFDAATGDMYIGDVGQGAWEEIDFEPGTSPGGLNYEWRVREGDHVFSEDFYSYGARTPPILNYPHGASGLAGCSVTGGVVYRGCRMPGLQGTYFFTDFCTSRMWSFRFIDGEMKEFTDHTLELNLRARPDVIDEVSSFGVDGRGEMYLCDMKGSKDQRGSIWRIVPRDPIPGVHLFIRGKATGAGTIDMSDAIFTLKHIFLGTPPQVPCDDALDVNDDGLLNVADAVYTLLALFAGGQPPIPPYPGCGTDATEDPLGCEQDRCR